MVVLVFEPRASWVLGNPPHYLLAREKILDDEGITRKQANFRNFFQKAIIVNSTTVLGFPESTRETFSTEWSYVTP